MLILQSVLLVIIEYSIYYSIINDIIKQPKINK